jgi:hypothetical protein
MTVTCRTKTKIATNTPSAPWASTKCYLPSRSATDKPETTAHHESLERRPRCGWVLDSRCGGYASQHATS